MGYRRPDVIFAFLLVVITATTFYPSLHNGFTNLDDQVMVYENAKIMSLTSHNIKLIFTTFHFGLYHPLVLLSYALEFHFFKLNPLAYHATNLVLHLLNSLLVYYLFFLLTRRTGIAFIVALLFGIHPLHVESVAWISERKDVLYAFFFLAALAAYVRYANGAGRKYYYLCFVFFLFSLLSKPMAVTLPFILLLFDYFLDRKYAGRVLTEKIPFIAVFLGFSLLTVLGHYGRDTASVPSLMAYARNVPIACSNLLFYLGKTFWPRHLSCIYPSPGGPGGFLSASFWGPVLAAASLSVPVIWSRKYTKKYLFGFLFFLIAIFPVLQLMPAGLKIAADRYTYIPLVGIFFMAGALFSDLYDRFPGARIPVVAIFAGIAAVLGPLSWHRCLVWKDSITLYTDVIRNYPAVAIAYNNRGHAYASMGVYNPAFKDPDKAAKALKDFDEAIRLNARYTDAYHNRGNVYLHEKEYGRAIENFKRAIKIDPRYEDAYIGLGNVFLDRNDRAKAFYYYSTALNINPRSARAYYNRGNVHLLNSDYGEALSDFRRARSLSPYLKKAYDASGEIYLSSGEYVAAIFEYTRVLKLYPDDAEAYNCRGTAFGSIGRPDQAMIDFDKAITLNPEHARAYFNRGNAHGMLKLYEKSIADYSRAITLDPQYGQAHFNRAVAYSYLKEYDKARQDVQKAKALGFAVDPGFVNELQRRNK